MSFIALAVTGIGAAAGYGLAGTAAGALMGGFVGSQVGGSILGANAAQSAAQTQAQAAQQATNTQQGMFNQVMGNLQPYMAAGNQSLSQLQSQMPSLTAPFTAQDLNSYLAPNYNFQLGQGEGQIQNAGAPGGMTGNTLAGLQSFAQNYAGNAYQNAFNNYQTQQGNIYQRLGTLAQLGQASATGAASGAPMFANGISQTIQGVGAANAAGQIGTANAVNGGLGNLSSMFLMNNWSGGRLFGTSAGTAVA